VRVQSLESHRHDFSGKHHLLQPHPPQVKDTPPGASGKMAIHAGGAAKAQAPPTASNCDAHFSESALEPGSSRSLEPRYMIPGSISGGEFNADEILSLSMSSTSFFPGVD
jgi:hypothetical protein